MHNLPPNVTDEAIVNFFNLQLNGLNVISSVDPCISAQISKDRAFALLEFKNPAEATVALALDGITMEDNDDMETTNGASNGDMQGISVRRPKDYIVPSVSEDTEYEEGVVSSVVLDTPNKISVTNLLLNLTDEQVTELLVAFGQLRAFVLVKDATTEESRVRMTIPSIQMKLKQYRVLHSVNTWIRPPRTLPSKALMAWNLVIST